MPPLSSRPEKISGDDFLKGIRGFSRREIREFEAAGF